MAAILLLLYGLAVQAAENSNVLIVDLFLNQQYMGDTFVLQDADGNYFIDESVLRDWEIQEPWPAPIEFRNDKYYGVHQFAGAHAELNIREMVLQVSMPPSLMPNRTVDMGSSDPEASSESFGAYLDYDLNWLSYEDSDRSSYYGLFRPVFFGKFGNISANTIYRSYFGGDSSGDEFSQSGLNVLELTYTRDDPGRLRSLRIGDIFAMPGSQGRALRIGGIQLATNFETQPTLITYPLPNFYGETAVPTALDIYVNGQLTRRENVQPGSYVLEDVPVVNGAGQLRVVARDALGRQQVFTQDFYSSTELLREGLSDYSLSLGALRENYGIENFQYGDIAASATWRHGLRKDLTVEGHAEITEDVAMISSAAQYAIQAGGTVSTALGVSTSPAGIGTRWRLGFRQLTSILNYNLDASGSTRNFKLVGGYDSPPKLQVLAGAGKNFYEYGSVGVSVVHQSFYGRPKRTIVSANHSKSFNNFLTLSTYLSYINAQEDKFSISIRFSMPFGSDHNANGGFSINRDDQMIDAEVNRSLPIGSGYGYHLGVGALDNRYIDAGAALRSEFGTYTLDVRNSALSGSVWQAGTRGSIAYLAGMTRFARQVNNAFAVVNVGNIEGVRVYSENIEIGRTNENGQIFVPSLRPYLKNQLRIEIDDLPLNARIGDSRINTSPYDKSGVVVNFDVHVTTNVILRAVLPDGSQLPEGAIAKIFHSNDIFPIGTNGKLYLQGIDRSSEIEIRWNGTVCDIDVPYPSGSAVIAKMGDIVCIPRKDQ